MAALLQAHWSSALSFSSQCKQHAISASPGFVLSLGGQESVTMRAQRLKPAQERAKHERGLRYAYRDRRNRKRDFRSLWIMRINAAAHEHGMSYSQFMHGLYKENVRLSRKVMAEAAIHEPEVFKCLADVSDKSLKEQ